MEKETLIKVRGLRKKFSRELLRGMINNMLSWGPGNKQEQLRNGEFWALEDVDFDLYRGEILGVIGPNGSGKTTLMRILSNIYESDGGDIEVNGSIATIFALRAGLHPHFTGRENIYLKAAMYGLSKKEIDARLDFIIDFSELKNSLDTPLGMYSSGMRARLAFAVGMSVNPDILIIDEALAVGDIAFRHKCFDYLIGLKQKMGLIFVSNSMEKIETFADRVMVMHNGRKVYESGDVRAAMDFYAHDILLMKGAYDKNLFF